MDSSRMIATNAGGKVTTNRIDVIQRNRRFLGNVAAAPRSNPGIRTPPDSSSISNHANCAPNPKAHIAAAHSPQQGPTRAAPSEGMSRNRPVTPKPVFTSEGRRGRSRRSSDGALVSNTREEVRKMDIGKTAPPFAVTKGLLEKRTADLPERGDQESTDEQPVSIMKKGRNGQRRQAKVARRTGPVEHRPMNHGAAGDRNS